MMEKNHKKNIIGNDSETSVTIRLFSFINLTNKYLGLLIFLVFFSFFACKNSEKENKIENQPTEEFVLNQKICTDFAYKIHHAIVAGEKNFINNYVVWDNFQKKMEEKNGVSFSNTEKEIFKHLKESVNLDEAFQDLNITGAHLRFVTYYHLENEHYIIFRTFIEPQTLNYIELKLESHHQTIEITDLYDFNQGMFLSEILREKLLYFSKFDAQWMKVAQKNGSIYQMIDAEIKENNFTNAYLLLKEFDQDFKTISSYLSLEESILMNSGISNLIIKALEKKTNRIPLTEKARWLHLFYYNALQGKYNDAEIALINLEKEIGKDDVLTFLKGNLEIEKGNYENAIVFLNEAIANENEIMVFHLAKVIAFIEMKEFEKAAESLLVMDDFFKVKNLDWNKEFESYPAFLKSDAYSQWKKRIEN